MTARTVSESQIDDFFQHLEAKARFPEDELRALVPPEIYNEWALIGATQSVSWVWVMFCELSLASFLTPNARFQPLASTSVYSLTWSFLLHPGSRHTSNLLRLYHNVLHALEIKANNDRADMRAQLRQHAMPGAAAQAALKRRLKGLGDVSFRAGTGSLEGIGLKMSSHEGRTAAGAFLVEGSQFVQWLTQELGLNKAIATQLWERMAWQRDVVNNQRSFQMTYPFFGVLGALHVEDLWNVFAQGDPLGLRGRICLFYTRPTMKRAREIRNANAELGNEKGTDNLEMRVADKFYRVYKAHAVEHVGEDAFRIHLGYPFRNYDFPGDDGGAAQNEFDTLFDMHAQLQEETYLAKHEESKRHGKLKGKHLRHALNWTNVMNARTDVPFDNWQVSVNRNALKAASLIGDFCENIASEFSKFVAAASTASPGSLPGPDSVSITGRTHADKIKNAIRMTLQGLLADVPNDQRANVRSLAAVLLKMRTVWIDSTSVRGHAHVRDALPAAEGDDRLLLAWRAMTLVATLQLGAIFMSINPAGAKKMFLVKREMPSENAARDAFVAVLECLEVEQAEYVASNEAAVVAARPAVAPAFAIPEFNIIGSMEAVAALEDWQ